MKAIPDVIDCPCGHMILTSNHRTEWPSDRDLDMTTRSWNPLYALYSFVCWGCGRYFVNQPPAK